MENSPATVYPGIDAAEDQFFNALRNREYARLDRGGHAYLDYTGGNLYGESQVKKHHDLLLSGVFGNPHSVNPTSRLSTRLAEEARRKVLEFFRASGYYCIFTQNASGALKIVGESYPFGPDSQFLLLSDNHNSVNGIREYARNRGGDFEYCPIHYEDLTIDAEALEAKLAGYPGKRHKLFAYPAQSNVSGVRHSLDWVDRARERGWDVLLDAAAFVPTGRLDLSRIKPDFVSVSFYKIFGYPTGVGCLLVRKEAFPKLKKPWFAGGTVTLASVRASGHYLAGKHERFEDGTINYLDLPAVGIGLDFINDIGIDRIGRRVSELTGILLRTLPGIRYGNGNPVVHLFGPENLSVRGGTVIMTFYRPDGRLIPFEKIDALAAERMISLRSGCFCNPGIDEVNHCISNEELARYFSSHRSGNYRNMVAFLGKMRGATRISVGLATTLADLHRFFGLVEHLRDTLDITGPA